MGYYKMLGHACMITKFQNILEEYFSLEEPTDKPISYHWLNFLESFMWKESLKKKLYIANETHSMYQYAVVFISANIIYIYILKV